MEEQIIEKKEPEFLTDERTKKDCTTVPNPCAFVASKKLHQQIPNLCSFVLIRA
jgi:hypothetical protein